MDHKGKCWRTKDATTPASSEERQCGEAARRLLFNDTGEYRGDGEAVFLHDVCADNDTRGKIADSAYAVLSLFAIHPLIHAFYR